MALRRHARHNGWRKEGSRGSWGMSSFKELLWRPAGRPAVPVEVREAPAALLGLRPAVSLLPMAAEAERLLAPAAAGTGAPGTRRPRKMT